VHLAVGSTPRVARRYRGRDVVAWLDDMGYYDLPVERHPLGSGVRRNTNHYVTGRDGGRDIDLRRFAAEGMRLHGRLVTAGPTLGFADDLAANLDRADEVSESIKDSIDRHVAAHGLAAPTEEHYRPVWAPPGGPSTLDAAGLAAIVWCVGFRADYSWVGLPVFDGRGYPAHHRGVTSEPGLYVLGLPWLHTWGSGRFAGVGRDAEHLAGLVRRRAAADAADLAGRPRLAAAS
jgi:putative flavoprotein involved in K+ transport